MPFVRHDGEVYTLENLENSLEREQDRLVAGLRHFREVTAKGDMPGAAAHDRENAVTAKTIDILRRLIDEEKTAMTPAHKRKNTMATILTADAMDGYNAPDRDPDAFHYFRTSPACYGFLAGQTLRRHGEHEPIKATMGRGYSVNVWTAGNRFRVVFDESDDIGRLERIGE